MANLTAWKVDLISGSNPRLHEIELSPEVNSLDVISRTCLPDGAYTTFRTYQRHKALFLEDHFSRLEETARLADHPIAFDHGKLRLAVHEATRCLNGNEARVRITMDLEKELGVFYIAIEPLIIPAPEAYQNGVKVVTHNFQRNNPKAKLTDFIAIASRVRLTLPEDVNDALLCDAQGIILEGMTSNFFGIKHGELWTADEGVLSGITRATVLQEAKLAGIPIRLEGVLVSEIKCLDEAFITSSSRGVLPVRKIDDQILGAPGSITRQLGKCYNERIMKVVEAI